MRLTLKLSSNECRAIRQALAFWLANATDTSAGLQEAGHHAYDRIGDRLGERRDASTSPPLREAVAQLARRVKQLETDVQALQQQRQPTQAIGRPVTGSAVPR